jgi:hypothetical protein
MIRTFRAFYLGRSLREKLLLVILFLVGIGIWLSHFCTRAEVFFAEARHTGNELNVQKQWLANREVIFASAEKAASKFDPSSTLSSIALTTAVTNLATDAGLSNTRADDEPDVSNGQFAVHTLRFEIPKADWDGLKTFYSALQARHPYITIETFQILQDKGNHAHTVNLVLSSVEIERGAE